MILIGHRFIKSENLYHVLDIESITHTPPNGTLYVEFSEENLDIIEHANLNGIAFALTVQTVKEIIYANALGAKYIVVPKIMAKTAQDLAENYLFDAKILARIEDDNELDELALLGVDGVLYPNAIIKINS